jgi:hypothetical protein
MASTQPADRDIPALVDANPIKIFEFKTSTLTRINIQIWKLNVREFYQTQGYWKVVKQTLRFLDSANMLRRLLENPKWSLQDITTRIYIKMNISDKDKTSV